MKFTKIPVDTFKNMALNAGVLLDSFDPQNIPSDEEILEHIIAATTGGVNPSAVPEISDLGEDIDNCPKNTKELAHLDNWTVTMSGTFATISIDSAKIMLAAADIDRETGKITLRNDLDNDNDFKDIWWVCDYNNGKGFVGCHIMNALSTGGFAIKSTDQAHGTADFEFTGYYSIEDQDQVPFECFIVEDDGTDTGNTEPGDEEP